MSVDTRACAPIAGIWKAACFLNRREESGTVRSTDRVTYDTYTADSEKTGTQRVVDPETIRKILDKHSREQGALIAILEDIQAEYGYLPEEALRMVGKRTGRSLVDIYGIATFYHAFSLKPRGRHLICACSGTACHVRGAPKVIEEFERQLGIKAGQTTPDGEFTFQTVNCLGACALGPIVVVDGHYFSNVKTAKVKKILMSAPVEGNRIENAVA